MDFLWDKITEWLKEMLIGGIVSNLSGMFDATNQKVAEISGQVGLSPQAWNGSIFSMIQNLSETVIVPIAGAILAFVMTLELIQLITDKNNLNDMDTWIFFKWAFKSAAAVLIVTNTWTIVMGVFDAAQSVVASASGLIIGDTSINISSVMVGIEDRLMEMELGPLFGLWFQSLFVGITMWALTICIFIITFGRMIEIYLVTSVAPIPMATMMGKEWGGMGQNYIRSLLALGFQAFLIIVCVAIYAVLVQNIALVDDIIYAIWTCIPAATNPNSDMYLMFPTPAAARTLAALIFGNTDRSIVRWYLRRWSSASMFPVKTDLPISWSVWRRSLQMNTGTTTGAILSASLTVPFWRTMMSSTSEPLFGTPPLSVPPMRCCPAVGCSREITSSMRIF